MPYTPYELATTLQGHSSDVRHILAPQAGVPLLLSGSRDGSAIVWGPTAQDPAEWDMKLQVHGPENKYISCVGMVRANGEGEYTNNKG
jgi:phospholipase A-2-activating protein